MNLNNLQPEEKTIDTSKIRNREFLWKSNYFEDINEELKQLANELLQKNVIIDVFLENNIVIIEHCLNCNGFKTNNVDDFISENKKTIKMPYLLTKDNVIRCKNKDNFSCKHNQCLLLILAYLYHTKNTSIYSQVREDIKLFEKKEVKVVEEVIKENEFTFDKMFSKELQDKYHEVLSYVLEDELIPDNVKDSFYQLIKIIINYKDLELNDRPILNYSFAENTETVNKICLGQRKCIDLLCKILKYFDIISDVNSIKYVDFKELTSTEILTTENYKQDVIVLTNLYYLTAKEISTNSFDTIIKNNFASYILNNSNSKIFIICDKNVNVKDFFNKMPQLDLRFEKLNIPDLKVQQVFDLFLKKVKNPKNNITLEENFEEKFLEYLTQNYHYSPYQNLEFIDYLYQSTLKYTLKTNHPKTFIVNEFEIFRNNDEEFNDLEKLIGLKNVKNEIKNLKEFLEFKIQKEKIGDKMPSLDLHMCYLGNPGTGKTTVARLMAGILFNLNYIRYNKCLEVEAKDLIANIPGATAMKTAEVLQEAMGGILFIDEAYSIGDSPYGAECIAALIKAMEDYRDDLVVILAGYNTEMQKFLKINSGFTSRIAYTFNFEDYSNEELIKMTENLFKQYNFQVESYLVIDKINTIYTNAKKTGKGFGNSRFVRNTVNKILRQHAINTVLEKDQLRKNNIITVDDVRLM